MQQSLVFVLAVLVQSATASKFLTHGIVAKPDPTCASGVLSLGSKACCAGYCGECSDYPTCKNVRGQASEGACCMSKVLELECGKGAAANVCLKKCSEAVPPCIMDEELPPLVPAARHAQTDCNEAVTDWRDRAESATTVAKAALVQSATASKFLSHAMVAKPDPTCGSGVLSLGSKACCAGYCGECSDYPTCKSVRGQASEGACCMSKVLELECGKGAAANVCLKKCSEAVPPCIMDEELPPLVPAARHAQTDCNEAVTDWRDRAETATTVAK